MQTNLVIVESPAKSRTIQKYLGKNFQVESCFGHIVDLPKKSMGIELENNFKPNYKVSLDKESIVKNLKKQASKSDIIWLASDEDREGEAIAWHLFNQLGLKEEKTRRIVFNEITKSAISRAIENPRKINLDLVNAQQARRLLDRIVGFELSPVLWKKVKGGLSAGRVQSVAVRLIVEREQEIEKFKSKSFFRTTGNFLTDKNKPLLSELTDKWESKEKAQLFLEQCINACFSISNVEVKPTTRNPSAPFITSSLQQEASQKLRFSVAQTMINAQKLYEAGLITYMRTDSVNLSEEALSNAEQYIKSTYGNPYSNPKKYKTKSSGAQEAHEAIRPTNFSITEVPNASENRLYQLIWKRTIASQMASAKIQQTIIEIANDKNSTIFRSKGEVILFEGFLRVYSDSVPEENQQEENQRLPKVSVGDSLKLKLMTSTQKYSKPPTRFGEASLVKKLEDLGIGRPSTYAPTISTIQKREYVEKKDNMGKERQFTVLTLKNGSVAEEIQTEMAGRDRKKLVPTEIGVIVNEFLVKHFDDVLDYQFTANLEKKFDSIAQGNEKWEFVLDHFYKSFHPQVDQVIETADKSKGERTLGQDPKTGKTISVRLGRYGPMVQKGDTQGEEKPSFASIPAGMQMGQMTLEDALELFKLPRDVGTFEEKPITVAIGRYGPYVKFGNLFVSIPKEESPMTINEQYAIELIKEKREKEANKYIHTFDKEEPFVYVLNGRYGPYIRVGKKNHKIPKDKDPKKLTREDCIEICKQPKKSKK